MKTRILMIIGIITATGIAISLAYYTINDSATTVFLSCDSKYQQIGEKCVLLKPEQYCKDWCDAEELSKLGCDRLALDYIFMATNIIDGNPDEPYYWNWIGMPDGLSEEEFERCSEILKEKRTEHETNKLWKTTDDWNSLRLVRNSDNLYCNSANEEITDHCYSLENIVFGDSNKKKETGWKLYPGGAGWTLPENSVLTPIYKKVDFGISPLNFTAMLDDKIFVDKCESNGGMWNYIRHDCEGLWQVCRDVGGITIQEDITPSCVDTGIIDDDPLTVKVCHGAGVIRASCVFEYEN